MVQQGVPPFSIDGKWEFLYDDEERNPATDNA